MEDDPYTAAQKKIAAEREALEAERKAKNQTNDDNYKDASFTKYPLEELQKGIPEGVNPARKEYYLSEEDFMKTFNMPLDAWENLKDWKRKQMKKAVSLF